MNWHKRIRWILPGVLLMLGSNPVSADVHVVQPGETLAAIARTYECALTELRAANPDTGDIIVVGQPLNLPPSCVATYTVEPGDTLTVIARKSGFSLARLRAANPNVGDNLSVGQRLNLPRGGNADSSAPTPSAARIATARSAPRTIPRGTIDGQTIPSLMTTHGCANPGRFKALVVDITLARGGNRIHRENWFDYKGTGSVVDNWNPASTVKLFSAIGGLQFIKSRGFNSRTTATFHDPSGKTHSHVVADLIAAAIDDSDNIAHNRLVQLAGHEYLNGRVLNDLQRTAIHKAYSQEAWKELTGGDEWLRNSPLIDLRQGTKSAILAPRRGSQTFACPGSSACSTLVDLATVMKRFMLHEQLPPSQRYSLTEAELHLIRRSMRAHRKRGMEVVSALVSAFPPGQVLAYHKPGFAGDWMSDVVYLFRRQTAKRWIVVLAAHPGRDSVTCGARAIGRILASGDLE